jgi:hypothetical protein
MNDIRIVDMVTTAKMLIRRCKGTKGIWVEVGWNGDAIGVGDVRKSLPMKRVSITPQMTVEDITFELRAAAATLVDQMPGALAEMKAMKRRPTGLFTKPGLYRRR